MEILVRVTVEPNTRHVPVVTEESVPGETLFMEEGDPTHNVLVDGYRVADTLFSLADVWHRTDLWRISSVELVDEP